MERRIVVVVLIIVVMCCNCAERGIAVFLVTDGANADTARKPLIAAKTMIISIVVVFLIKFEFECMQSVLAIISLLA